MKLTKKHVVVAVSLVGAAVCAFGTSELVIAIRNSRWERGVYGAFAAMIGAGLSAFCVYALLRWRIGKPFVEGDVQRDRRILAGLSAGIGLAGVLSIRSAFKLADPTAQVIAGSVLALIGFGLLIIMAVKAG